MDEPRWDHAAYMRLAGFHASAGAGKGVLRPRATVSDDDHVSNYHDVNRRAIDDLLGDLFTFLDDDVATVHDDSTDDELRADLDRCRYYIDRARAILDRNAVIDVTADDVRTTLQPGPPTDDDRGED